jgi:tRNA dimethylallyltransferase
MHWQVSPRVIKESGAVREQIPLVVILGPTAVGKSELAIQLGERLGGEIVSADTRLFYRGMNIGTAKPSPEERSCVPHHLIDIADPDEIWSLAQYKKEARRVIEGIHARRRLPFLVGGSGQYIWAVVRGWDVPEVAPNLPLRHALEQWSHDIGKDGLHQRLIRLDPQAAARIDARNLRRTIRALEVILTTGKRFSEQRTQSPPLYNTLILGLRRPRPELYERIDARIDAMFQAGLVDEVQGLLESGYSPDLPPLSAIGYREVIAYIQGSITLEGAKVQMRRLTRTYVRRQANWFKPHDPQIRWFPVSHSTVDEMEAVVSGWIS